MAGSGVNCYRRGAKIDSVLCGTCAKRTEIFVYSCTLYGKCTFGELPGIKNCVRCLEKVVDATKLADGHFTKNPNRTLIWAYGVTTVHETFDRRDEVWTTRHSRLKTTLPKTLESLKAAGFDNPRLFVDGLKDASHIEHFGLPYTLRYPAVFTVANWQLALLELMAREPTADRYILFQDDLETYKNLRQYLEQTPYPEKGYCNLITQTSNELVARLKPTGWHEAGCVEGKAPLQTGRGAVALMFDRAAALTLMQASAYSRKLIENFPWRTLDGCIVTAMNQSGYREYVHSPSLVTHTGHQSSMGGLPYRAPQSFKGATFDALQLLR